MPKHRAKHLNPAKIAGEGRDELNLANFPISVLRWQQPVEADGRKVHRVVFPSSRFDNVSRRQVEQRVTLTSEEGLPTPTDERVVLALLSIAKHTNDFADPRVAFYPHQVIRLLRWPANSQHYRRLRDALRRLKALTIRYENAWWTADERQYEAEFATGIIASYHLARLVRGRKKNAAVPTTWVEWHPDFFTSLQAGNVKRLDLDFLLSLRLPIAQRMYRFLDRRFYRNDTVELDLTTFACGHIGLSQSANVAELKRCLLPSIVELERRGYIRPMPPAERFIRLGRGVWRVRFERAVRHAEVTSASSSPPTQQDPETLVVREWYRLWSGEEVASPRAVELADARNYVARFGYENVRVMLPLLVERLKAKWPDARTFRAVREYIEEVAAESQTRQQRADELRRANETRQQADRMAAKQRARQRALEAEWAAEWQRLSPPVQTEIEQAVLAGRPMLAHMPHQRYLACLEELARRSDNALAA